MSAPGEESLGPDPHFLELLAQARSGNQEARETLVKENLRLVSSLVGRFAGRGLENDDLMQIGTIGLIRALDRFDTSFGVRFSTYAVPMIIGEIRRVLRDQGPIKLARSLKERAQRLQRVRAALEQQLGREPTIQELAEAMGISVPETLEAFEAGQRIGSLEEVVYHGDREEVHLGDRLVAEHQDESHWLERLAVRQAMEHLDPEERQVLLLRYGRDLTQMQVAERLDMNQVRVSRLERRALMKIRQEL